MTLTPSERRGALTVLALFALGAARDLWELRRLDSLAAMPAGARAPRTPMAAPAAVAADSEPPPESDTSATLPSGTSSSASPGGLAAGRVVDLNTASADELDGLPGVGPVLAARILEYRRIHGRFRDPEELLGVRGVGPRLMARLKLRVAIGPIVPKAAPAQASAP